MSVVIEKVTAREIFDSRGNPTVEADVILSDSTLARSAVPSGASTGKKEAVELRDGGKRLNGRGVKEAVRNIKTKINQALHGVDPQDQERVDRIMIELDGTSDKRKLGANAILAVSMANCRAAANSKSVPLYRYLGGVESELPQTFHNVINGGEHADNKIDIQEFMITPIKRTSFLDGFEKIVNTYHGLKQMLEERGYSTALGDEGGFAPNLKSSEEALQLLHDAIITSGYQPGTEIGIAFDAAASYFYDQETKSYEFEGNTYTPYELSNYYKKLLDKFPEIISIEDPFSEDDWGSFITFTQKFKDKIQIVADDLVCTNPVLIQKATQRGLANTILIKLNQIGTVTETLNAIRLAKKNNYKVMISHRSGETGDTFISDFTVATKAGELKSGAPARSERVEKYNQLIRIEEEIN